MAAAAREVEEETGWRPESLNHLISFEPSVGTTSSPQHVFVASSTVDTQQTPDINEAEQVAWIPLTLARQMIQAGEIVGAASVIGILAFTNGQFSKSE